MHWTADALGFLAARAPNKRMKSRQYIFFDLGWTLEDETQGQIDRADTAAKAARELGVATTADHILALQEEGAAQFVPSAFRYALSCLGLDEAQADVVQHEATWNKALLSLYPDARAVLDRLAEVHFLGLIANQSAGAERRLSSYGIREFFRLVFSSAELGMEKPDPRVFRLAQDQARCSPEDAWMIGDRIDNDIRPAKAAGWQTIRVLHGYNCRQQPRDSAEEPDHTVRELSGLLEILL